MGSLDDNECWSQQTKGSFLLLLSQIQDVSPCSGHSMALFKLKCDLSPDSSALCCDILSQYWSIMWDPHRLIAIPSLYLDLMMNPMRDKPITHAYQWRDSATIGHSRAWEELPLKIRTWPYRIESPFLFTPSFFFFFFFKEPHWVVGPPSQHWDWHQRSHLITLWGIWEVSAIKWSGAIK